MIEEYRRRINQENFERAISEIEKLNPNVVFCVLLISSITTSL